MNEPVFKVMVQCNLIELTLFRRALAQAVDQGLLSAAYVYQRLIELDELRWSVEESTIANHATFPKIKPGRPLANFDRELAKKMRSDSFTLREIAIACKVSKATICRYLNQQEKNE